MVGVAIARAGGKVRSDMYIPLLPISERGHRVAALRLGEISVRGGEAGGRGGV